MVYIIVKKKNNSWNHSLLIQHYLIIPSTTADPSQDPEPNNLTVTAISYSPNQKRGLPF